MTTPDPRPGFKALLRASLPASWGDWAAIAGAMLAMRFLLHTSLTATFVITGIAVPATVAVFAAGRYALARLAPPARDPDDGTAAGDGS